MLPEKLTHFLRAMWSDAEVDIADFAVIAGGYSEETYRFDAKVRRGGTETTMPMILRKDPPPLANILPTSREVEHELLMLVAEHTNIPVAKSYVAVMDPAVFGEPAMLIERMRGSGEPSALFHGGAHAEQAEGVATHICELMAELHMTDPGKLNPGGRLNDIRGEGIEVSSWDAYMDSMLGYYVRRYPEMEYDPAPVFLDVFLQMRRSMPRPLPLRVVHGDYNPSNFLYEGGRVTAVIDWENSHIGDPREDLGWLRQMDLLTNTDIMGSVRVDGGFLGHYNKITGFNVTEEEVDWFRLFTGANIGIPVMSAVARRVRREHEELMHLYIMQPVMVAQLSWAQGLGYPMEVGA
ncbi:MAG: phosphotransferase family protein [Dehalococcoidia bacterium]